MDPDSDGFVLVSVQAALGFTQSKQSTQDVSLIHLLVEGRRRHWYHLVHTLVKLKAQVCDDLANLVGKAFSVLPLSHMHSEDSAEDLLEMLVILVSQSDHRPVPHKSFSQVLGWGVHSRIWQGHVSTKSDIFDLHEALIPLVVPAFMVEPLSNELMRPLDVKLVSPAHV